MRCPGVDCRMVISASAIQDSPIDPSGHLREITCPRCHCSFLHEPLIARGDPRNIAYIGDVFQLK